MSGWSRLDRLLDEAPGEYSVCVRQLDGVIVYAYAADVARPAASLIKVPLAMALVASDQRRRAGRPGVDLDVVETLREADRTSGDGAWEGSFDTAPAGARRTRWQLIDHALRESDNTAANLLIKAIGMQQVNHFMSAPPYCLTATRLQRRFIDYAAAAAGRENWTTAGEMCLLFAALARPDTPFEPLLSSLKRSPYDDALVAGLPPGTVVAHKVGGLPGIEHDAGIVYAPCGPYVVALLSQHLPDAEIGKQTMTMASRLIYKRMIA